MKVFSYVVYVVCLEALVWGGFGYVVFFLGQSGWWILLACVLSSSVYPPERWSALWDDKIANKYRLKKDEVSQ